MPQASLLSYFPRPRISSGGAAQPQTPRADDGSNTFDPSQSPRPTVASMKPSGIIEEIRRQTPHETPDALSSSGQDDEQDETTVDSQALAPQQKQYPACVAMVPHIPEAMISTVQNFHLPAIQRLTSTTLPVRYGDNFFASTVTDSAASELSRVLLYSSNPVGWIRCRLEPSPSTKPEPHVAGGLSQIYIQALTLLSPYRGLGLATMLLDAILETAIAKAKETVCIYAHVWEKNEDALDWYAKRDFKRVVLMERYYRRLNPGGAWIVRRDLDNT